MSESKILVVTGGSRGIGAATARLAAASGWWVCIAYLSGRDAAEGVVRDIAARGGRAIAVQADISSETGVVELFRQVDRELGRATALVNNAATWKLKCD
jgi:NAD(P)-dependent dehydrogenase (short-subunit alcohol dehydrogenase family)